MKRDNQTQHGASDKAEKSRATNRPYKRSDLAFVRTDDHGETNCWSVNPSGDTEQDFKTGSRYGLSAIAFAEQVEDCNQFLVHVFRDMFAAGQFGHLEAGFVDAVSHAALLHNFSSRYVRPKRSL